MYNCEAVKGLTAVAIQLIDYQNRCNINQNKMPQPPDALNPNIRKAQPEARELAVILSEAKNPLKNPPLKHTRL